VSLIDQVLKANPRVLLDPPALVQPVSLGDSSVAIAVKPWVAVQDQVVASGEICAAVLEALRARGIVIPPPQREVRMLGTTA
jgi:small conductance mechanosensitive channel